MNPWNCCGCVLGLRNCVSTGVIGTQRSVNIFLFSYRPIYFLSPDIVYIKHALYFINIFCSKQKYPYNWNTLILHQMTKVSYIGLDSLRDIVSYGILFSHSRNLATQMRWFKLNVKWIWLYSPHSLTESRKGVIENVILGVLGKCTHSFRFHAPQNSGSGSHYFPKFSTSLKIRNLWRCIRIFWLSHSGRKRL